MRFPITFVFVFGKGFAAGVVKMANRRTLRLLSDSQNDQLVMKSLLNIVGNRASTFAFSQVGIGTTSPHSSSILDLTATDKANGK